MDFIVGADIYDHLEKVVDRFEDVSNGISGILIEHLEVMTAALALWSARRRRPGVRFHERAARRRQFDRHHRLDPGPAPRYAVAWAAFFNFVAFLFFGLHVAKTVGAGIVSVARDHRPADLRRAMGAISWNIITWLAGIPSSSLHALVGGLVGAGLAKAGPARSCWTGVGKTAAGIVVSPADRLRPGARAGSRRVLDLRARRARRRSTASSARCSSSPPRSIRSATAATTPRRPWASSPCCSIAHAGRQAPSTCRSGSCSPARRRWRSAPCPAAGASCTPWARGSPGSRPMQGFCAETGGAITLFTATYARRAGLHHPHHHRRHRRRRRRAAHLGRALGRRAADRRRLDRHHADGRPDRRRCSISLAAALFP